MKLRLTLVVVVAVLIAGGLLAPDWVRRYRAREFTPVMREYVRAGLAGDSVALVRVSSRENPVAWALKAHRTEPRLFPLASEGLEPEKLARSDTGQVRYLFRFRHPYTSSDCQYPFAGIYTAFRRSGAVWRLVQAGLGPC